jgi:hypothetical protein
MQIIPKTSISILIKVRLRFNQTQLCRPFLHCSIFRTRLAAAEPSAPGLSFLDMAQQLGRMEAARLFYQVLVAKSAGFIQAQQELAYGDIVITAGQYL